MEFFLFRNKNYYHVLYYTCTTILHGQFYNYLISIEVILYMYVYTFILILLIIFIYYFSRNNNSFVLELIHRYFK